ncbi:MAG: glycosyltransferase family 1 protein [Cyanobacteria bacterium P01_D01_bin.105]
MFVNLAYLLDRPTGTTSYALNLLPYLAPLSPTYFATPASGLADGLSAPLTKDVTSGADNCANIISVPTNMTAAAGSAGHLRRLIWTQFQLPQLINAHKRHKTQSLLFTPIPEAPLSLFKFNPLKSQRLFRSVITFHDLIPLRFPQDSGAIKYYFRYYIPQVLSQAKKVICISEATARDVVDFYGIPAHKLVAIPLAYDSNHFYPHSTPPSFPPELEPMLERMPYFLTLGRQAPHKNIKAVVEALAQVPNCGLLIAGPTDPRYTPQLKKLAEAKGVQSRVKFLSYVSYSQLPALLSSALALVFPSLWEGFGLPVLEAMACGTPVITSNLASLPEVAGDAAYLIDPRSVPNLVEAMRAISTDGIARQHLREAGLQRVQEFSWERTGKATAQVLQPFAE